jgi:hypothetical protein
MRTSVSEDDKAIDPEDFAAARRAETRRAWDARLRTALTFEWQSSKQIATTLNATHGTVLERLKDMMRRGLVERKLVRERAAPRLDGLKAQRARHAMFKLLASAVT